MARTAKQAAASRRNGAKNKATTGVVAKSGLPSMGNAAAAKKRAFARKPKGASATMKNRKY